MPAQERQVRRPTPRTPRFVLAIVIGLALACLGALPGSPVALTHAGALTQGPSIGGAASGLWVVHPFPDQPTAQELVAFTSDGLMLSSGAPSMPAAPGEAPAGVSQLFASQGYGVWRAQADHGIVFKFLQITYDPDGNYLNTVSIHGSVTADASGNSFSGTYVVTVMLPDGTSMDVQGSTPVSGSRVTVGA
jgi:hypothetical protein